MQGSTVKRFRRRLLAALGSHKNYTSKNDALTKAGDLSQMVCGYYICKIMVIIAYSLIKADVILSVVVTNCKIMVILRSAGKVSLWLCYAISHA